MRWGAFFLLLLAEAHRVSEGAEVKKSFRGKEWNDWMWPLQRDDEEQETRRWSETSERGRINCSQIRRLPWLRLTLFWHLSDVTHVYLLLCVFNTFISLLERLIWVSHEMCLFLPPKSTSVLGSKSSPEPQCHVGPTTPSSPLEHSETH